MNRSVLRWVGILTWVGMLCAAYMLARMGKERESSPVLSLQSYFQGPRDRVAVEDTSGRVRLHDPVFFLQTDGAWQQVGFVDTVAVEPDSVSTVTWHADEIDPGQCRFTLYRNRGRLEDVVSTMFPPEMRLKIQERLTAVMSQHGDELSAAFVPLVQASLQRSMPVIEEEFRLAVERHRPEIEQLGDRWNEEVVSERLIPLARREIMPIVREHGEPTAEEIGRELWDRASLWRFGWRAMYDRSPLPRKDLLQEEWDRFVDNEAVPVFEQHMDDIVTSVQEIVAEVAANEVIRSELADVASGIASDADTQRLVREILKETLIDNQRLRDVWSEVWSSADAQAALDLAGDRLEPVIRQIGDDLFGSREEGINPNFARVLRNQILGKDRQWLVASLDTKRVDGGDVSVIRLSADPMPYPIVYLADRKKDPLASLSSNNAAAETPSSGGAR
ncbi:MAG: hypothetical protein ACR2NZ_09540 [Rubripirellula sp.]